MIHHCVLKSKEFFVIFNCSVVLMFLFKCEHFISKGGRDSDKVSCMKQFQI